MNPKEKSWRSKSSIRRAVRDRTGAATRRMWLQELCRIPSPPETKGKGNINKTSFSANSETDSKISARTSKISSSHRSQGGSSREKQIVFSFLEAANFKEYQRKRGIYIYTGILLTSCQFDFRPQ